MIEKLSTSIDPMMAKSSQLKEHVAALQKALAEIAASQAEMGKLREEEHEAYVSNKADMEQGLEGIKTALKILREFYANEDKAHTACEGAGAESSGSWNDQAHRPEHGSPTQEFSDFLHLPRQSTCVNFSCTRVSEKSQIFSTYQDSQPA